MIFKYYIIFLFLFSNVYAESTWRDKQGNIVEKTKSMNSKDGFGANLVSVNEKNFFKVWNTPSQTVNIDIIDTIHRNDELIFPIMFGGCQTNKENKCNIVGDFVIIAPDGSTYANVKKMLIFNHTPSPNHGLNVSNEYVKVIIEKTDLLGGYKVNAHILDVFGNVALDLETSFTVVDDNITIEKKKKNKQAEPYHPTKKDVNVSKWMTYAYLHGYGKDKDNIIYMLNSRLFTENEKSLFTIAIFMAERFKIYDAYLIENKNKFSNLNENALKMLLIALKQADTKNSKILYKELLPKIRNKRFLEYLKKTPHYDALNKEIKTPAMIDVVWASFMSTGEKVYIEKIIQVLSREEKGMENIMLLGSVKWSLSSNIEQHKKVFNICKEYHTNDINIKKHLDDILNHISNNPNAK
jgi:hypothetical protein